MESIASFVPKCTDHDSDIRYMAISDLNTFLESCVKGDKKLAVFFKTPADQQTVFDCLLKLIPVEKEGTVQEQVQKCLYLLCQCADVKREYCTNAIRAIVGMIKADASSMDEKACNCREVASVAFKEAIKGLYELPDSKRITASFAPDMFGIAQDPKAAPDARVKACECFTSIIQNNPEYVAANGDLTNTLFHVLSASTAGSLSLFRKRLVNCIVTLSSQLPEDAFAKFVNTLCEKLSAVASEPETPFDIACSIVQIIGAVGGTANGSRIANRLNDLLPRFAILCKEPSSGSMDESDGDDANSEALDELRSLVFQSCEILLGKCSASSLAPLIRELLNLVAKFISYNRNGIVDEDDDDDDAKMADGAATAAAATAGDDDDDIPMDDDDDGFDDDFGSDFGDEDISDSTWKIRRDAIRCFIAISNALAQSPVLFVEASKTIFTALRKRLNDYDESVLLEAITAVSSAIRSCSRVVTTFNTVRTKSITGAINDLVRLTLEFASRSSLKLSKILSEPKTSVKVRTASVQLAATLVRFDVEMFKKVEGDANQKKFAGNMESIWNSINSTLSSAENSSTSTVSSGIPTDTAAATLKVESLHFLQAFFAASSIGLSTHKHATETVPTVIKCIADTYVHSSSEALRVVPTIMTCLKKEGGKVGAEDAKVVEAVTIAVVDKYNMLGTSNLEYDVKECSITALVSIVTAGGGAVAPAVFKDKCLPIVQSAIQNESTRLIGVKALNEFASSCTTLDISSITAPVIDFLTKMFADRSNKQLRQSSLAACASVLKHEASAKSVSEAQAVAILNEIYSFISVDDLYLSHLVINVAANVLACCSTAKVKNVFAELFMDPINVFIKSQPLQGATLSSFVLCFNICGKAGVFSSPKAIVDNFLKLVNVKDISKQIIASVATICASYINGIPDASIKQKCITDFIEVCKKPFTEDILITQCFCMLTIGHVGRECDLSAYLDAIVGDDKSIAKCAFAFDKGPDDIRSTAATMLGCVTAGCISKFISAISAWSKKAQDNVQYYVLSSLREFASRLVESNNTAGSAQVCLHVAEIVKALVQKEDEGKRNIAAECLGRLCALTPTAMCPVILSMATDSSKEARTVAAGSVRVMYSVVISGKNNAAWQSENKVLITRFIYENASVLFGLVKDAEVQVRHVILLTLNYVLHQNPSELLPVEVLEAIAPAVLSGTNVDEKLIDVVQYGPHKVKQDRGIEARKAAFECLSALLDSYPDVLSLGEVVTQLGKGLQDEYDIILLTIQICCKLALSPLSNTAIVKFIGEAAFIAAVTGVVFPKSGGPKKEDEEEHKDDAKKKIMRAIAAFRAIPGVKTGAPELISFINTRIVTAPSLSALLKEAEESLNSQLSSK